MTVLALVYWNGVGIDKAAKLTLLRELVVSCRSISGTVHGEPVVWWWAASAKGRQLVWEQ